MSAPEKFALTRDRPKNLPPWARILSTAYNHRKFIGIEPAAIAIWAMGLSYCADQGTDGHIPAAQAFRLITAPVGRARKAIEHLVRRGLWDLAEIGDGYIVHDWLAYNPSVAELEAGRGQKRAAGLASAQARAQARVATPAATPVATDAQQDRTEVGQDRKEPPPTPPAGGGASSETPNPEPTPVDQVCALYRRLFAEKYKAEPLAASVRERTSVGEVVKHHGLPRSLDLMRVYFASADAWVIAESHPLGGFRQKAGRLLADQARKAGLVKDPPMPRPTVEHPRGGGFIP